MSAKKRFYKTVSLAEESGGLAVTTSGRGAPSRETPTLSKRICGSSSGLGP